MPRVHFENLTRTARIGGAISGTLVVESDQPVDPMAIRVNLTGAEKAFVMSHGPQRRHGEPPEGHPPSQGFHIGPGPGRGGQAGEHGVEEIQKFLEQAADWTGGGQQQGTTYRLPFSFPIPDGSFPSLRTGVLTVSGHRVFHPPRFGMFVEYTLEGRVHHPMWMDNVDLQLVQVVPPPTHLGYLSSLRLDDSKRSLTLMVNPESPAVTPGVALTGFFQVLNPQKVKLETLTVALVRRVAYSAQGIAHMLEVPRYEQTIDVPHHEDKFAGRFSIAVPDDVDTLPSARGTLFATEWFFSAHLKGGILSEPITVESPVAPPPAPAGPTPA